MAAAHIGLPSTSSACLCADPGSASALDYLPEATSGPATHRAPLDTKGDLVACEREHRCPRGQIDGRE